VAKILPLLSFSVGQEVSGVTTRTHAYFRGTPTHFAVIISNKDVKQHMPKNAVFFLQKSKSRQILLEAPPTAPSDVILI